MSETNETSVREPCCEHATAAQRDRRNVREHAPPMWMEAAEIGAILVAAGGAHALANALGHRAYGAWLLMAIGAALMAAAVTGRRVLRRAGP